VFADLLQRFRLPSIDLDDPPFWGIAEVSAGPTFYQPEEEGLLAAIVPAVEDGEIVDLVACGVDSRQMRTRRGIADLLGYDCIPEYPFSEIPLPVYDDVLGWLRAGCQGVVVLDWQTGAPRLRHASALCCESEATADRLLQAFQRPPRYPEIFVRNGE